MKDTIWIKSGQKQFKANLHSHSTLSDGKKTPEELVAMYKDNGYSILCISDHEYPCAHNDLTTDDFLLLTGYEAYIRPSKLCLKNNYKPEIHLNLIARNPENINFIGYNPVYCKYISLYKASKRPHPDRLWNRSFTVDYIQKFIDSAVNNGYIVSVNHPCWSMQDYSDVMKLKNYYSMEVFNYGSMLINGYNDNMLLYDAILRSGNMIYCHGSDDNHNYNEVGNPFCDSFGAWTMVISDDLSYESVFDSLVKGNFYATTGPTINRLEIIDGKAYIETSDAYRITMHVTPKESRVKMLGKGQVVNSAEFDIPKKAPYVYFTVIAEDGTRAYTHAFKVR